MGKKKLKVKLYSLEAISHLEGVSTAAIRYQASDIFQGKKLDYKGWKFIGAPGHYWLGYRFEHLESIGVELEIMLHPREVGLDIPEK